MTTLDKTTAQQFIGERLERFLRGLKKQGEPVTNKDYARLDNAIADMAESINLAECNRCGEFFSINDLQVYAEYDTNFSEYVCNTCWK